MLILSYEYPPIGGGVAGAHYARAWARQGHASTRLTSGAAGLPPQEQGEAIDRHHVPGRAARASASLRAMLAVPLRATRFALKAML